MRVPLKPLWVALILFVAASVVTAQRQPTGREVLRRMQEAYGHLKAYADTGTVSSGADRIAFRSFYIAPGKLYFEFTDLRDPQKGPSVLWATGIRGPSPDAKKGSKPEEVNLASSYLAASNVVERNQALSLEIAGFQGVSYGSASTVLSMLIPQVDKFYGFRAPKDARLLRQEMLGPHSCYLIESQREREWIWIDSSNYAIRRIEVDSLGEREVTVFEPTLDSPIDESIFTYQPPKGARTGSPLNLGDAASLEPNGPPSLTEEDVARLSNTGNAKDLYELAQRSIQDPKGVIAKGAVNVGQSPPKVSPELATAVKENRSILAIIARALDQQYTLRPKDQPRLLGDAFDFPILARCKSIAKFACTCGDVALSEGRVDEAVTDYELAFRIGGQLLEAGDGLIEGLDGIAIETIARRSIERVAGSMSDHQLHEAANLLFEISKRHRSFDSLRASELDDEAAAIIEAAKNARFESDRRQLGDPKLLEAAFAQRKTEVLARYARQFSDRGTDAPAKVRSNDPTSKVVGAIYGHAPDLDQAWLAVLRNDTWDRLLALNLAALGYHAKHGVWPGKIEDLVSEGLRRVPDDPFWPWHPMHMSVKGKDLLFYSLGPDGLDDHGQPLDEKALKPNSKGDIVQVAKSPS